MLVMKVIGQTTYSTVQEWRLGTKATLAIRVSFTRAKRTGRVVLTGKTGATTRGISWMANFKVSGSITLQIWTSTTRASSA